MFFKSLVFHVVPAQPAGLIALFSSHHNDLLAFAHVYYYIPLTSENTKGHVGVIRNIMSYMYAAHACAAKLGSSPLKTFVILIYNTILMFPYQYNILMMFLTLLCASQGTNFVEFIALSTLEMLLVKKKLP